MTTRDMNRLYDQVCPPIASGLVYHYGAPMTAHAIAFGSPLRAALSFVMNDRSEVETGRQVVQEYTEYRMRAEQYGSLGDDLELPEGEVKRDLMRLADAWLPDLRGLEDFGTPSDAPLSRAVLLLLVSAIAGSWLEDNALYIACASTVEDRLSQWRAYGSCVMGLDASRVFGPVSASPGKSDEDAAAVESRVPFTTPAAGERYMASDLEVTPSQEIRLTWRRVLYTNTDEVHASLASLTSAVGDVFAAACRGEVSSDDALAWAMQWYITTVGLIKDATFIEESEVRLVVAGAEERDALVHVRQGPYGLAPYIDLRPISVSDEPDLDPPLLRTVSLGPGVSETDERTLTYLLRGKRVSVNRIAAPAIVDR
ncbi:hypothetical protein Q9R32_05165 [Actinotalea sp. AC32]|nr:hypothetical protein [Actinotalea sp. AC32]